MSPTALPHWLADLVPPAPRQALTAALTGGGPRVRASALAATARLLGIAALARAGARPLLLVTPQDADARRLAAQLEPLFGDDDGAVVLRLPALDADPYRAMPAHPAVAAQRVSALDRLVAGGPLVAVVPAVALLTPVPQRRTIEGWARQMTRGVRVDLDRLARDLVGAGYRVVDVVGGPGDLARRGGLFDVWPPQEDAPLRVELFGDEVESVRRFDAGSQRTIAPVESFRLLPAREAPIGPEQADRLLDRLVGRAREVLFDDVVEDEDGRGKPRPYGGLLGERLAGLEGAPSLYRDDLVPLDALVDADLAVWEPDAAREALDKRWDDLVAAYAETENEALPAPDQLFVEPARLVARIEDAPVHLSELPLGSAGRVVVDLGGRPAKRYDGHLVTLADDLRRAAQAGRPVVLLTRTPGRRERLREVLGDEKIAFRAVDEDEPWEPGAGEIVLAHGALEDGVEFTEGGALVVAEPDLFGTDPPPPPPRRRRGGEAFVSDLRDLKQGDLVVHVDHGIGRYLGLSKRPVTGEELLLLEYASSDRLYVPVSRLDLIQKYSGGSQSIVPLDRLGGPGWDRRRRKVTKAVEEMAEELLELYAKRKAVRAPSFAKDSVWQGEFEGAFPHELTQDQAGALADIKSDLASGRAMDRLLCGDVGFGKTEVALRAAFKVAQDGHQVAVLAPTTVLAFQHLTTFRARLAAWPIRIEMVSRFVPPQEVARILEATAKGEVDILIGTHRLLSKDVTFKRLSLLIIDEEQRFGVRHKETVKQMALGVHTLSLTATPIPRTLQMSLAGVRDLSVIETPPRNRLAIQTNLAPFQSSLIAAAVRNELRRGGQVYYITPRVQGIEEVASDLKELVPEAVVAHAHGQMPEGQLEKVMLAFIRGEVQVLVATTIIENGLDIPRANTIVVREAHRFGLAQLYQMRGRVGRSDQRAYAYLLVPPRRELTPEARRRLAALVEFTELGAGFRIAALDMEIRGAGEFLGARQSGHIGAVGFELYAQLLERAVRRLSGEALPEPREPVAINLDVPAFLPEDYVGEAGQRLSIYKRLSAAEHVDEVAAVRDETRDRFGPLPDPAVTLFRIAELRTLAESQGAVAVDWTGDGVSIRYGLSPKIDADKVIRLARDDRDVRITPGGVVKLRIGDERADRITVASLALRKMVS